MSSGFVQVSHGVQHEVSVTSLAPSQHRGRLQSVEATSSMRRQFRLKT